MFKSKKVNMIIALITSIILWMYVIGDADPVKTMKFTNMPIQFINTESLASNGLAIDSIDMHEVDFNVEGKRSRINEIKEEDFRIIADLYGRHNGKNYVTIEIQTPRGIKVTEKSREKVMVDIGTLVSASREVKLDIKGALPENTSLGEVKIDPKEVTIYGTKDNIDKVKDVRGRVSAKSIKEDMEAFNIDLEPKNSKGKNVNYVKMSREQATAYAQLIHAKNVPVEVETRGQVDDSVDLDTVKMPESALIEGDAAKLSEINELKCKPVNIEGITKSTEFELKYSLPKGVKLSKSSDKLIAKVILKDPLEKKIQLDPASIKVDNLAPGLEAKINEKITITVKAKQSIAESLSPDDFKLTVDGAGLDPGIHSRALAGSCKKKIVSFELNPSSVKLEIKEAD